MGGFSQFVARHRHLLFCSCHKVEQLKSLLISGSLPEKTEREAHLLELLKSAQEEREELFRKQTEWSNALRSMEADCKEYQDTLESLQDKIQVDVHIFQ